MEFLIQSPHRQAAVAQRLKAAGFEVVAPPGRETDEGLYSVAVTDVDESQIGEVERIVRDSAPPPGSARLK